MKVWWAQEHMLIQECLAHEISPWQARRFRICVPRVLALERILRSRIARQLRKTLKHLLIKTHFVRTLSRDQYVADIIRVTALAIIIVREDVPQHREVPGVEQVGEGRGAVHLRRGLDRTHVVGVATDVFLSQVLFFSYIVAGCRHWCWGICCAGSSVDATENPLVQLRRKISGV